MGSGVGLGAMGGCEWVAGGGELLRFEMGVLDGGVEARGVV